MCDFSWCAVDSEEDESDAYYDGDEVAEDDNSRSEPTALQKSMSAFRNSMCISESRMESFQAALHNTLGLSNKISVRPKSVASDRPPVPKRLDHDETGTTKTKPCAPLESVDRVVSAKAIPNSSLEIMATTMEFIQAGSQEIFEVGVADRFCIPLQDLAAQQPKPSCTCVTTTAEVVEKDTVGMSDDVSHRSV